MISIFTTLGPTFRAFVCYFAWEYRPHGAYIWVPIGACRPLYAPCSGLYRPR